MSPYPFCYRITKYDPADRDTYGRYTGAEDSVSDHGPVESAYLESVAAFAEDTGIHHLTIREPEIVGFGGEARGRRDGRGRARREDHRG
ncbi:hypothetical protein [Streptomyces sp. NPDC005181]|uniref:hypothetical protein n=1 Tax=Streptomyces sp. NPDC005181 TaxID=3156869 RepID=UPI0033A17BC8